MVAAYAFDLDLYPPSTPIHDAKSKDGREIQIKLTGENRSVSLAEEPEYLIALQLIERTAAQVYNGPGKAV